MAIGFIGAAVAQGYDMGPVAILGAIYLAAGAIFGGGKWLFTRTRAGMAIGGVFEWIVKAAVVLIVGGLIVWGALAFFGSMPWWAAIIIVLLVLVLLK
jgi:hypothetical protein